jgi:transposase
MSSNGLFPDLPTTEPVAAPAMQPGDPRVARPDRTSLGWEMVDLDQLVATDHPVRLVAAFVATLELGPLYHAFKARTHGPGRDGIDPALLLALWLYATIEAVGSARELARLCERDLPYRWLCGGVGVNHHALSDFRVDHGQLLDKLLTDSVTALAADGLIQMQRLAQDGVKLRASAGAASFRRRKTIARLRDEVAERIAQLRRELDDDPGAAAQRRAQTRARAAEAQAERLRRAQQRLSELEAEQAQRAKKDRIDRKTGREKEPRVSPTDPDARVMRMAAGAFRPAYNVQMGCDPDSLVVVDVGLEPQGADSGQVGPMLERIDQRYGKRPSFYLADAGFYHLDDIEAAYAGGTLVLAPSNQAKHQGDAAYAPRPKDGPGVAAWRRNMREPNGKRWYQARSHAECVFAQWRGRGLQQLLVRGASKVRCVALLHALAHNMVCGFRLRGRAGLAPA